MFSRDFNFNPFNAVASNYANAVLLYIFLADAALLWILKTKEPLDLRLNAWLTSIKNYVVDAERSQHVTIHIVASVNSLDFFESGVRSCLLLL